MLLVNIILILILMGFAGAGMKDGFVHTLGRVVGAVLGFVAANAWYIGASGFLAVFMPLGWAKVLTFLIIYVVISHLVGLAFVLVDGVFRILSILPFLKSINSLLGLILGFFEGVLIVGGVIYLLLTFPLIPSITAWLAPSAVAQWILAVFHIFLGVLL
ncbi:MAG: CvpA family protein [Patescibacteria group bacterium]